MKGKSVLKNGSSAGKPGVEQPPAVKARPGAVEKPVAGTRPTLSRTDTERQELSATKRRLDSISSTMCLAKWLFVKIHLTTGRTQSCYHVPPHFADKNEIRARPSALHNTKQKKLERKQMMEGKKPPGCSYCWRIEESGNHFSDRHLRSREPWAAGRFNEVVRGGSDYDVIPSYVELNLSNVCQFKCSYCYAEYSSAWLKELQEQGSYPTDPASHDLEKDRKAGILPIPAGEPNPYTEAFWKWWPELYSKVKVLRLTGGEPLIDPNTFKILDYVEKNPKPDMEIAFTTNLCPPLKMRDRFKKQMERIVREGKVCRFQIHPSIDSWGPQAEYIRHGLNVRQFEENVRLFSRNLDTHISFIVTVNALSIFHLKTLFKKILEWRQTLNSSPERAKKPSHSLMDLDLPYLRRPFYQSLDIPPKEMTRHYLNEALDFMKKNCLKPGSSDSHGFSYIQLGRMSRLLDTIKTPVPEDRLRKNRINFYKFFSEHDRRRNTNFLQTFPELKDFWLKCRELALEWDANPPTDCQKQNPSLTESQ